MGLILKSALAEKSVFDSSGLIPSEKGSIGSIV
jgi:hypothetical protein